MSQSVPYCLIHNLKHTAKHKCNLQYKHSAAMMKNFRLTSCPVVNSDRRLIRSASRPSLHAEAAAILQACGKHLTYSQKYGWRFLSREKGKQVKVS